MLAACCCAACVGLGAEGSSELELLAWGVRRRTLICACISSISYDMTPSQSRWRASVNLRAVERGTYASAGRGGIQSLSFHFGIAAPAAVRCSVCAAVYQQVAVMRASCEAAVTSVILLR